jgi:MFS family permease
LASLLPTLSLYLRDVGATKQQIGIVMGSFAIGLLVFRPGLGRLADQRGRKLVLLIGVVVAALAPLCYLFTQSLPLLMAIRVFHGISIAAFTTAYSALIVDLAPPAQRGELIGYMSLTNPIGMAIGPALGGYVLAAAGYTPLFLLAAGLGFGATLCALGIQAGGAPRQTERKSASTDSSWRLLLSDRFRIPTLLLLLIGLAFGTLSTFLPLFIQEQVIQEQETAASFNAGLFYTAAAIASFTVRLPTGRASDRFGRGRFITLSLILYTVSMLMLWQATQESTFLLAGIVEGAGAGIFLPTTIALLADRSQPQERGRVFGLCMSGFDLGIAIAGPTLGMVAEQVGYRGLFALAAMLTGTALVIFVSQSSRSFVSSLRFALRGGKDIYALQTSSDVASS